MPDIQYSPIEQQINEKLNQNRILLQTYRGIEAIGNLQEALNIIEKETVRWEVKAAVYRDLGVAYDQIGQWEEGLKYMIQSYEAMEGPDSKAASAGVLAEVYWRQGMKDEALYYAQKDLELSVSPELKSLPYQIKGAVAEAEGNYSLAIEYFNEGARYAEATNCLTDLAMIIVDISAVYMRMGMMETALSEVYRAERYVKENRNLDMYYHCAIRRAHILYMLGRDQEAKDLIIALDNQKNWA